MSIKHKIGQGLITLAGKIITDKPFLILFGVASADEIIRDPCLSTKTIGAITYPCQFGNDPHDFHYNNSQHGVQWTAWTADVICPSDRDGSGVYRCCLHTGHTGNHVNINGTRWQNYETQYGRNDD